MTDPRVGIALIGGGRMGSVHLEALAGCDRCAVVAVVDPDPGARSAAEQRGLAAHASVAQLLAGGGAQAALVAAPTDLHRALVTELADASIHVLCEKPCGSSPDDVRAAQAAAEASGVVLQVGYWRRFVPALAAVREQLEAGEAGELSFLGCHQWDESSPPDSFRLRSGGIATDMAVHEIDQARWLLGCELDLEQLTALPAGGGALGPGDPDAAIITTRAQAGGAGVLITLGRRYPPGDRCWLEYIGDRRAGQVTFLGGDAGQDAFLQALRAQADAFAEAVMGGPRRGASAADAIAALEGAARIDEVLTSGAGERVRRT